jgi:hypothetical protein
MQIPHTAINSKLDRPAYMLGGYSRGNHRMMLLLRTSVNGLLACTTVIVAIAICASRYRGSSRAYTVLR